jgi:hypothetical protein
MFYILRDFLTILEKDFNIKRSLYRKDKSPKNIELD